MSEQTRDYKDLGRFDKVDATKEAQMFLSFLDHVEAIADVRARRQRSIDLIEPRPGMSIAEIGCGTGTAARELAAMLGPQGKVYGFDISEAMIAVASERARELADRTEFRLADASRLPLADASLDAYRAERVYQHLADPLAALSEALRVLRPGGKVVLIDQDWDALLIDSAELGAYRMIARAFTDSMVNGTIGRQYARLLRDAGFSDVSITTETVTAVDSRDYGLLPGLLAKTARTVGVEEKVVAAWELDQNRRIESGRFFMAMTHFIAVGRKK